MVHKSGEFASSNYNSWPLGRLPTEFQRPEPQLIREDGYEWDDPRDIVLLFEEKLAKYADSKFAVVTDCASNALFLSLKYRQAAGEVTIPARTYVSVPMQIIHAGCQPRFENISWSGIYELKPWNILTPLHALQETCMSILMRCRFCLSKLKSACRLEKEVRF